MSKSLNEQIEAIRRRDQRLQEEAAKRNDEVSRIIGPIAEKAGTAIRVKIEDELKADLGKAAEMDLSKEGLKAAVEAFWAAIRHAQKPAAEVKGGKAKSATSDKAQGAPVVGIES